MSEVPKFTEVLQTYYKQEEERTAQENAEAKKVREERRIRERISKVFKRGVSLAEEYAIDLRHDSFNWDERVAMRTPFICTTIGPDSVTMNIVATGEPRENNDLCLDHLPLKKYDSVSIGVAGGRHLFTVNQTEINPAVPMDTKDLEIDLAGEVLNAIEQAYIDEGITPRSQIPKPAPSQGRVRKLLRI